MLTLAHVTFDCTDAAVLAAFWSAALDRPVDAGANAYFATIGYGGPGPAFMFLKVDEPKTAKNRCHVDLSTGDLSTADRAAECDRLVTLGAVRVSEHDEYGRRWTVLRDPSGNEFCVA